MMTSGFGAVPVLACATRGVSERVGGSRPALKWIAEHGVRCVTLDAVNAETRPRLLDRPARRELAAVLKRLELACAGVDLLIPAEHFEDPSRVDRAVAAVGDAIGLAAELRSLGAGTAEPVVCMAMGAEPIEGVLETIRGAAERNGLRVGCLSSAETPLGAAIELGPTVRSGVDAATQAAELGSRLTMVRVDRFDRQTLGAVPGCVASMSVASPGAIGVADLTDCADPERALSACSDAWRGPMG